VSDFLVNIAGELYIHPAKMLQLLSARANLLAEKVASPGLEQLKTELVRGQRVETLSIQQIITEALNERRTPD
jgi:hypothetical protein